jgi:hypothetical protein
VLLVCVARNILCRCAGRPVGYSALALTRRSFDALNEPVLRLVGERRLLIPRDAALAVVDDGDARMRRGSRRTSPCSLSTKRAHCFPRTRAHLSSPVRATLLAETERRAKAVSWRQGCSTGGARV